MILLCILFVIVYAAAIGWLISGFEKIKTFEPIDSYSENRFSIVVPFRNEAQNLPALLKSLSDLKYPTTHFEVILVDDGSTDGFQTLLSPLPVRIIKNNRTSNSPKKDAIKTAIPVSRMEWIVTTDADCVVNPNWLKVLNQFIQQNQPEMIVGAVTYEAKNTFLHQFQQLDLASLQGVTIGTFGLQKGFMCNGANLVYAKTLFNKINGFDGNDDIASGDDVFLLQKAISQFPEKVHYLKSTENIVVTKPLDDWKSLFHQRVRWASKTKSYQSLFGKQLGLIVLGCNLGLLMGGVLVFFGKLSVNTLVLLFATKFVADYILLNKTNKFLTNKKLDYLIFSSILYPLFTSAVALYSLFGSYTWKGRKFKI